MRKFATLFALFLFITILTFAQSQVVTGKVVDEKGQPVPFATVKVKKATNGVAADADGNFKISVTPGAVLVFSAIGGAVKEVSITAGQSVYNVTLTQQNTELTTVVVSALGIKRSVKSTPYAVQQISSERLTQARETDITSALSGKIAGLQTLGQSGAKLGQSGAIRLRGSSSLSGNTAIYVVDGTIVTNANDINMDDVASVSVLKGPNATALYGQRAEGGVIMITTKKGSKANKLSVDFNSTTTADWIGLLPRYQNIYGGGNSPDPNDAWAENPYIWKAGQPAEWMALNGYRRPLYFDDASWGPRLDGGDYIPWYAWYGGHADSYKTAKFTPQPNNIRDFYQTGITANNNISVSSGGKWWTGRLSYTNLVRKGVIPKADQSKHFISTQNSFEISRHFSVASNIGLTFEKFNGDFYDEYGGNTIGSFSQWFHRNIDMGKMKDLRNLKGPAGTFASWNIDDARGMNAAAIVQPAFWFNPYTWLDNLYNHTDRFRVLGDVSLTYKLNNNFRVTGTYRLNYRTTELEVKIPQILEASSGSYGITSDETGASPLFNKYRHNNTRFTEQNGELIAQYNNKFNDISVEVVGGGNIRDERTRDSSRSTSRGLIKPDVYEISNSKASPVLGGLLRYRQVRSLFFRGTIGYKEFLFLDFSGRNDWSSTLPVTKNSYFYPSIGTSFVFSDFMQDKRILSFGKLRLSMAQIGSDPLNPYALEVNYATGNIPFGSDSLSFPPRVFVDANIQSPVNTSYEAGVDLRFFKERLGLSVTGYLENKQNDIVTTDVSPSSGFLRGIINAGKVQRKGIEVELNLKPVVTRNFSWDVTFNWAMNRSTVKEVSPFTDQFTLYSNYVGQPVVLAVKDKQWGQMRATGIKRINGLPVIGTDGMYDYEENIDFGSVLPNYNGGIFNAFTWKGVTLTTTIDFQQGGKYFSFSDFNGKYTGLNKETAEVNDNGVNIREPLANGGGVHVYGVNASGKPYDTYVNAYDYFRQFSTNNIWDYSIFDASYIKLREVSVGYNIPVKKLGNLSKTVKGAYVSVVARNLWLIYTANPNLDPTEMAETYAENGQMPGTRSLGFNLKLNF